MKVNIKKTISLATSMMLVASMALATQGEIKVESDKVLMNGNVGIGTDPVDSLHIRTRNLGGVDKNLLVRDGSSIGDGGAVGIDALNDANNANVPLAFRASRYNFLGGNVSIPAGKLGIGVSSFENWSTGFSVFQLGANASIFANTSAGENRQLDLLQNAYWGGAWKYQDTDEASMYYQQSGGHVFRVAPSGAADSAISWTTALEIQNNGNVSIPNGALNIGQGNSSILGTLHAKSNQDNVIGKFESTYTSTRVQLISNSGTAEIKGEGSNVSIPNGDLSVAGDLYVNGKQVISSGTDLDGAQIKTGEVHKDRLWKNKGGAVQYSGGATDTGTSYAGATVMASGTFTQNGGDTTVTLPFDWSGGILHVWISHANYIFAQNTGTANTGKYTCTYDSLTNSSYTTHQIMMQNQSVNTYQINKNSVGGAPASAGPNYFVIKGGGTYYVKWQVIAPMK